MDIKEIFELLEKQGLNPKYVDIDKYGFSRNIEFQTKYQKCWIEWYINYSSLRIGDRYGNEIYFDSIKVNTTSPSIDLGLEFYMKDMVIEFNKRFNYPVSSYLVLKKLDWQEKRV